MKDPKQKTFNTMNWSSKDELIKYLYTLKEDKYREFSSKITPGANMIGIRIPILKLISKNINETQKKILLDTNKQDLFELKLLKGLTISNTKDIDEYKTYFDDYLNYIDNWAICDIFLASSKIIKKDLPYFFKKIEILLKTKDEFSNRIAFVILLNFFVIEEYLDKIFELINDYKSEKYYANMALGWLISVIYIKFPERTKEFLQNGQISNEVLKISIRKIKDSHRVSSDNKDWLTNLK